MRNSASDKGHKISKEIIMFYFPLTNEKFYSDFALEAEAELGNNSLFRKTFFFQFFEDKETICFWDFLTF